MAKLDPRRWWRLFLALPADGAAKAMIVAVAVSLVAATLVSIAAIALRPLQQANLERERQAQIVDMVSRAIGERGTLETLVIDLATGGVVPGMAMAPDPAAALRDPALSIALPKEADIAGIGRRANYATVFLRRDKGRIVLIVLPVHGVGYQSTLYGYLALHGDGRTVAALTFYRQEETPGLGARIAEPAWQALWPGKQVADETGAIRIEVVKGKAASRYEVDGITGATRTSTGVERILRFWLGEYGFARFLARVRRGEA